MNTAKKTTQVSLHTTFSDEGRNTAGLEKSQQNRKENHLMTAEGRTEYPALRCGVSYQGQLVSLKHMAGILVSGKPRGWKII